MAERMAPDEVIDSVIDTALEAGYRHIDTAYVYGNEAAIGKALKRWFDSGKIKREELFIVTKLPMVGLQADKVEKYLNRSLAALQLTYVDLYLIHFPCGLEERGENLFPQDESGNLILDKTTEHSMEAQVDAGKARSIGLSNFNARQIKRIVKSARIPPANLQVELHVFFQQKELVAFCKALDITVVAYAPIGSPGIYEFIEKFFDITLDDQDVNELNALDRGKNGRLFSSVMLRGIEKHPEDPFKEPY
uniref:NADP-dependent oxidoreductase domain-containing protein n=1 Tax=Timema shepardi TaxID=629360 RepID=A0A7R9FWJ2_TIMSH|nr:unnamed protein product [Timema shepardi]